MKKLTFVLLLIVSIQTSYAQWTREWSVGYAYTSPTGKMKENIVLEKSKKFWIEVSKYYLELKEIFFLKVNAEYFSLEFPLILLNSTPLFLT